MAKNLPFKENPPVKSATEFATRTVDSTGAFFKNTNEKYQISEKTSQAAAATKAGAISLWGKAKGLFSKKDGAAAADGQAASASEQNAADAAPQNNP